MRLVLPVKDHKLYSQKLLKDLPKEHRSFLHYLVLMEIKSIKTLSFIKIFFIHQSSHREIGDWGLMQVAVIATEMYSRIGVLIHLLECIPIPITVRVLFGIIFWCWVAITKFLSESAKLRATRALVLSCVFPSPLDSYPMCTLTLWTQFPYVSLVHLITSTLYANIF